MGVIELFWCCCKLPWLPLSGWLLFSEFPTLFGDGVDPAEEDEANRVGANGGRLIIELLLPVILLFSWFVLSSRFSLSKAACCNFSSLIADMSSNFWVSNEERDNISCNNQLPIFTESERGHTITHKSHLF